MTQGHDPDIIYGLISRKTSQDSGSVTIELIRLFDYYYYAYHNDIVYSVAVCQLLFKVLMNE